MDLSWSSPVGMAAFLAGAGIFFFGFFFRLYWLGKSKSEAKP